MFTNTSTFLQQPALITGRKAGAHPGDNSGVRSKA